MLHWHCAMEISITWRWLPHTGSRPFSHCNCCHGLLQPASIHILVCLASGMMAQASMHQLSANVVGAPTSCTLRPDRSRSPNGSAAERSAPWMPAGDFACWRGSGFMSSPSIWCIHPGQLGRCFATSGSGTTFEMQRALQRLPASPVGGS